MSEPVQIIATLYPADKAKAERMKQLISQVAEQVEKHEPDVLQYRLQEQLKKDPPLLIMVETYKSREAILKHSNMPYFKEFLQTLQKEQLVSKPMSMVMAKNVTGFASRL